MTILRTTLVALGVLFLAFAARAGEAKHEGFNELSVDEVADLIAKRDIDIFDNNAYDDWKAGRISGDELRRIQQSVIDEVQGAAR